MSVTVWATAAWPRTMRVLVVLVMFVRVLVFQRFMQVLVDMALGEVQPHTQAHQRGSHPKHP